MMGVLDEETQTRDLEAVSVAIGEGGLNYCMFVFAPVTNLPFLRRIPATSTATLIPRPDGLS